MKTGSPGTEPLGFHLASSLNLLCANILPFCSFCPCFTVEGRVEMSCAKCLAEALNVSHCYNTVLITAFYMFLQGEKTCQVNLLLNRSPSIECIKLYSKTYSCCIRKSRQAAVTKCCRMGSLTRNSFLSLESGKSQMKVPVGFQLRALSLDGYLFAVLMGWTDSHGVSSCLCEVTALSG